ncbi:uncharacterized protein LOC131005521 isoform X2 [Salvia miltiorrhiza]|uniref:uncharacterized protein LOC131005521 isoform X2 n=1 Tax=Salvia miltiorrhiza TaxID=226208 RepID=UPI0025AC52FC|nr:uncharacterized protein LOC131005521 isoform X2 [Salvia miltiorrhiza]
MAARGLLAPFHFHYKFTAAPPVPTCISWLQKTSLRRRRRHARFFCSHRRPPETDISSYRLQFAQKMAMAGLNPNHRIAIAVSGGPDSIALCVLTLEWKSGNSNAANKGRSKAIDGLLAIVVDHGLRTESAEEADLVRDRVLDMGIKCEVASCKWLDGKPKLGHLQEAARDKRYETLQKICIDQHIGVLLVAHHADDQAELFILRLSRNSGVLGLAGMAFTSQRFSEFPDFSGKESKAHSVLLVRPLLEFSKEDMYNICRGGHQQWVEDPTNRSPLYVRNRIRMSLSNMSSVFKAELQATISACRRTRMHVEKLCRLLLNQAVTIMPHGYAVIDLGILHSMPAKDIYVAKFVTLVVQFISQRQRPVRGNGLKLLLNYLHTTPCKAALTVAGCYLCPAPGSKGTRVLVCCSSDSSLHLALKLFSQNCYESSELEQIPLKIEENADKSTPDPSSIPFLDAMSSEAVLIEAKTRGILSNSSHETIVSLQKQESENFKSVVEGTSDHTSEHSISASSKLIRPGQVGYFMNRFLLDWNVPDVSVDKLGGEDQCSCSLCIFGDEMVAEVRCMVDADWMYLHDLSKTTKMGDSSSENGAVGMNYARSSASRALATLKLIPVAARRALPVLVNAEGVLLSVPSIGFSQCPHLKASAVFSPRIPLGGGHSSFL